MLRTKLPDNGAASANENGRAGLPARPLDPPAFSRLAARCQQARRPLSAGSPPAYHPGASWNPKCQPSFGRWNGYA